MDVFGLKSFHSSPLTDESFYHRKLYWTLRFPMPLHRYLFLGSKVLLHCHVSAGTTQCRGIGWSPPTGRLFFFGTRCHPCPLQLLSCAFLTLRLLLPPRIDPQEDPAPTAFCFEHSGIQSIRAKYDHKTRWSWEWTLQVDC